MPLAERDVVLRTVLVVEVTPVTRRMPEQQVGGVQTALLHEGDGARSGHNLTEREAETAAHAAGPFVVVEVRSGAASGSDSSAGLPSASSIRGPSSCMTS